MSRTRVAQERLIHVKALSYLIPCVSCTHGNVIFFWDHCVSVSKFLVLVCPLKLPFFGPMGVLQEKVHTREKRKK